MSTGSYDAIVIGLGAMGAATLMHLARAGKRVVGIDRFSPPHAMGSSHGESRITRLAIGEGEVYTPFAIRSHELWREIAAETKEKLLFPVGGLMFGALGSGQRLHNKPDFLATTIAAAKKHGIDHDVLQTAELRRRFPQFALEDSDVAYFERDAGYVKPEACIRSQLTLAERFGARISRDEEVLGLAPLASGGVSVRTARATHEAEQVVVCAGAWLPKLLPQLARQVKVTRQLLFWFGVEGTYQLFAPERFPVFIRSFRSTEDAAIYGFPAIDGPNGGIKVASGAYGAEFDPDAGRPAASEDEIREFYEQSIRKQVPALDRECLRSTMCLYSVTEDSDFIVDRLPGTEQIVVVSACSGHGFKHSAALGESVAQLVVGQQPRLSLAPFSVRRLGVSTS